MSDRAATPESVINLLSSTAGHLEKANLLMQEMEESQRELLRYLNTLTDLVEEMQIKRDAWRFRAEEMEKERNQWQHRCEENERLLRLARTRAIELAETHHEIHCPNCGSAVVAVGPGDGSAFLSCSECGYREELVS